MGYSIAYFDNDGSLQVDTVGFLDGVRWGLAPGVESSEQKRIRERYTLSEDDLEITFSITIEGTIYLTESVAINGSYFKVPDDPFDPYVCDMETAGRHKSALLNTP